MQYLELQKYRPMDKFEYEIDFPAEYSEWPCCKLFLQPFIENPIMHGWGIGIRNVVLRMRMFFGPAFEVTLDSAPGEGTRFTFWLPLNSFRHADDCEEE